MFDKLDILKVGSRIKRRRIQKEMPKLTQNIKIGNHSKLTNINLSVVGQIFVGLSSQSLINDLKRTAIKLMYFPLTFWAANFLRRLLILAAKMMFFDECHLALMPCTNAQLSCLIKYLLLRLSQPRVLDLQDMRNYDATSIF